jgi:hypothetical protein
MPTEGFLHLTLIVGDPDRQGRVIGRVVDNEKRPLRAAQLTIGDHHATTNESGSFMLDSIGLGSQSIETRAIGYSPRRDVLQVSEAAATEFTVVLNRVVVLPAVRTNESAAAINLAEYLHEKKTDATGATFIEPIRIAGYKSQQSTCSLVSAATRLDFCRRDRPFVCRAIFVNGEKTALRLDDIEPDDIIGVEGFRRSPPSRYAGYPPGQVCPFVIWTRCPGATVPTCDPNSTSKPTVVKPRIEDPGTGPFRRLPV